MSIRLSFTAILLCICGAFQSDALDPGKTLTQSAHRIWSQEEGLVQPTVYSILQSHDGFLWLGTQDSLIRFDGARFHEFDDHPNAALHRALVRALLEDAHGNLWAGTIGSGLVRISSDSVVTRFTAANGFPGANAFCLDRGDGDDLWVCATEGIVRFHHGAFETLGKAAGLPAGSTRATCKTQDGTRWVATDSGLAREINGRFEVFSHSKLPADEPVTALQCDAGGGVWVGTNSGLLRIRGNDVRLYTTADGLPDNAVLALAGGSHGSVWIGTDDGVSRFEDERISVYRTRDGLSHSLVLSLFEDREGTLWAGTKNGLDQFTDGVVTPYTTNEGLSNNNTGPLVEDKDGRLWIGTLGGGLNVFENGRFRSLSRRNGLLDDTILSLALDGAGDLWVGTRRGLNRLRNGVVQSSYTREDGLSGDEIRTLVVDAEGTLWVGTNGGLDRWNGVDFERARVLEKNSGNGIVALFRGQQVKLFISTDQPGLYVLRDGKLTNYQTDVSRPADCLLLESQHHEAWIGTLGSGLLRWKAGSFTHVRVKDGLYDNRIYAILRDDDANLWLASSKGIFRVSEAELDDLVEGRRQFVDSLPFTTGQLRFECQSGVQPAAIRTRDGRLWFSTTNGVVMVDPRDLARNRVPPMTHINAVLVNGRRLSDISAAGGLHLRPLEKNIEIRYAGLSFLSPEKVSFRYMLEGFDRGWTDAGNRREAFFTNLPPGHFLFKVMSRNADGVWSREPAVLEFSVAPLIYQQAWFFPLLALLVGLAAYGVYRIRIRQLEHTFQVVISERSRIARELHDTLLQGLSGVTMQLQALWVKLPASKEKHWLEEIIKDASRTSSEARQSLWGLRSKEPGSLEFHEKLAQAARQAVAGSEIELQLQLDPVSLGGYPELEYQLLRIANEAIANTLSHAKAQTLRIHLQANEKFLQLHFTDDGIGFDPEAGQPFGHYGLIGMRERADEIGAYLKIDSGPGQGTSISIAVPLTVRERSGQADGNVTAAGVHHRE